VALHAELRQQGTGGRGERGERGLGTPAGNNGGRVRGVERTWFAVIYTLGRKFYRTCHECQCVSFSMSLASFQLDVKLPFCHGWPELEHDWQPLHGNGAGSMASIRCLSHYESSNRSISRANFSIESNSLKGSSFIRSSIKVWHHHQFD